jgi:hypothetical protein
MASSARRLPTLRFPSASSLGISTSGSNGHSIASASRFTLLPKKWTSKEASTPAFAAIARIVAP